MQLWKIHGGDVGAWQTPDVQLLARAKLLKDLRGGALERGARLCAAGGGEVFGGGFPEFLRRFLRVGGVIEAQPGTEGEEVVGRPCVNVEIRPRQEGRATIIVNR